MGLKSVQSTRPQSSLKGIRVLFLPDAGPSAGLGHVRRCLSLAAALQALGAKCSCLLTNGDNATHQMISLCNHDIEIAYVSEQHKDFRDIISLIRRGEFSVAVVDSYRLRGDHLLRLREEGLFVVCIDDLAQYPFPCQLVVNSRIQASQLPYRSSSGDTRFLLGNEYALLSPEFWHLPDRKPRKAVQNVLLTLGGLDVHNLMSRLIRGFDDVPDVFDLTCVIGPFFQNRAHIETTAKKSRRKVMFVDPVRSLCDVMREADLAVSAGGQTLFELAAVGTPTIAVQVADNQAGNLQDFAEKGIIRFVGRFSDPDLMRVMSDAVSSLAKSSQTRLEMSEIGMRLIDGLGASRVAGYIAEGLSSK
jgi:UDP-2,4-diacetamido-2,4,6-trideoxy-beta-L-altropyranose hydrolase